MTDALSLDEAWAEAEAAMPEGWVNGPTLFGYDVQDGGRYYVANVEVPRQKYQRNEAVIGDGPTPADALHALTVALRARNPR